MVEKSMNDDWSDEVSGHVAEPGSPVSVTGSHREAMHVSDNDYLDMADTAISTTTQRNDQVDCVAIEYLDGCVPMPPRTLGEEAAKGGYAQEGDQSYPASGPRVTAGTRGAADQVGRT